MATEESKFETINETIFYSDMQGIIREEFKKFKKEIIEEIEKRYCEHWCIRED